MKNRHIQKINLLQLIYYSFNYLFFSYKSGIFDGDGNTFGKLNMKNPEWQKVDHSVVLVGYGVENGIEYWLLLNSWGNQWGENGYIRIKMQDGEGILGMNQYGLYPY